MRTTVLATLLALGTLAALSPLASADLDDDSVDSRLAYPLCYWIGVRPGTTTVNVGSIAQVSISHGLSQHVASGCIL